MVKDKSIIGKVKRLLASQPNRTFKPKEMARMLGVSKANYMRFMDSLKKAVQEGQIAKHKGNNFGVIKKAALIEGELHVKTQGYGFLITEEGSEDVFISQKNMGIALHKDIVKVQLYAKSQSSGRSREGQVIEIIKRSRTNIVGTYTKSKNYGFVVPDNMKITRDLFIPSKAHKKAKSGQKVVAQIVFWEDERTNPEGEIIEILGFPDDPGVDVISLVKDFDLPTDFSVAIENEAAQIPETIPKEELKRRLDLRKEVCFTIDPVDAKDFDDAISIKKIGFAGRKGYELGVHIADVSHFVRPKSKLDKEAFGRATSIYLVDRVIPMLPERISTKICSLRPHEDRLTFSCIMEINKAGDVVKYKVEETVINSKRRFTYEEVQSAIDKADKSVDFYPEIKMMHDLSKILTKKRAQQGSLDFNIPEVRVELNANGEPIAINKRERTDSNRLVEEFMLLANQTVTEHVAGMADREKRVPPFIYRIHDEPDQTKIEDFRKFVKALGYPLDPNKKITTKLFGEYLKGLAGIPEQGLIENLMLRSMMKAKYSTDNVGHFGLAFKNYTHFTSPIRRYPDLEVHRTLKKYKNPFDFQYYQNQKSHLDTISKKSSEQELVALEAERESIKLKKVEYMQRHLGDEFDAVISGVVAFGIFAEITDILVEGLIHISDLDDDYYFHDEKKHQLVGERNDRTYRLGDPIKVKVVRVDVAERVVDFLLA